VTFLNEPGEGSGVARAFYTALAEAILVKQKLPNMGPAQVRLLKNPLFLAELLGKLLLLRNALIIFVIISYICHRIIVSCTAYSLKSIVFFIEADVSRLPCLRRFIIYF
jgi:hypothetical protein